jgi:hypothetical protein
MVDNLRWWSWWDPGGRISHSTWSPWTTCTRAAWGTGPWGRWSRSRSIRTETRHGYGNHSNNSNTPIIRTSFYHSSNNSYTYAYNCRDEVNVNTYKKTHALYHISLPSYFIFATFSSTKLCTFDKVIFNQKNACKPPANPTNINTRCIHISIHYWNKINEGVLIATIYSVITPIWRCNYIQCRDL